MFHAHTLMGLEHFWEAASAFKEVLTYVPDHKGALVNLATCLNKAKAPMQAK